MCFVLVLEQQFSQAVKLAHFYWFYRSITNNTLSFTNHNVPLNRHKIMSKILWPSTFLAKIKGSQEVWSLQAPFFFYPKSGLSPKFSQQFYDCFIHSISLLLELKISSQWCDLRCHFCGPLCICRCESFSLSVWVSMVARDENEGMCYCYDTPCARNRLKSKPKKRQKHKQIHYPRKKKIIYE